MILICISLIISNGERLFICLLEHAKYLFRFSAHFFYWIACFDDTELHELFVNFGE